MAHPLRETVATLPHRPGVYLFKDAKGVVIYVGKAKNLHHRVSSYFQSRRALAPDKRLMVTRIVAIEHILVRTETEAFLLEGSLIKRFRPRFNIVFRDDKSFVYLRVSLADPFPQLEITRQPNPRGARLFGPFTSTWGVRQTLKLAKQLFHYCAEVPPEGPKPTAHACFDVHLGRCVGACVGRVTSTEYRALMQQVVRFLEGHTGDVLRDLERQMRGAAASEQFERAAQLRDRLGAVQRVIAKQRVISPKREDLDLLALARSSGRAAVVRFQVRRGALIHRDVFTLDHVGETPEADVLVSVVSQLYAATPERPPRVVLPVLPADALSLGRMLGVRLTRAGNRGALRDLVTMGEDNARHELATQQVSWQNDRAKALHAVTELARALQLPRLHRIECFDNSNIQGTNAVAGMVVFEDGLPKKRDNRTFTIKTVVGADDIASMEEVLTRRLRHLSSDDPRWPRPDLIIVDGGLGQLNAARRALRATREDVPVIALAKEEELVFRPGIRAPLRLPRDSEALYLLQRIRDEAHRVAIGTYRAKHGRTSIRSLLDDIPGIGARTKATLLRKFGSLDGIKAAPREDVVAAIGNVRAERLFNALGE